MTETEKEQSVAIILYVFVDLEQEYWTGELWVVEVHNHPTKLFLGF